MRRRLYSFVDPGKDGGDLNGETESADADDVFIQPAIETATATGIFSLGKDDGVLNGGTKKAEADDVFIQPETETATAATGFFSLGKSDVDLECSEDESSNSSPVKI